VFPSLSQCSALLIAENLIQPFNDVRKFIGSETADFLSNALGRSRTNLTDLNPRPLWHLDSLDLVR
jgi:hypothetical protein